MRVCARARERERERERERGGNRMATKQIRDDEHTFDWQSTELSELRNTPLCSEAPDLMILL